MPRSFVATIEGEPIELTEERIREALDAATLRIAPAGGGHLIELRDPADGGRTLRVYARALADGRREVWIGRHRVVVDLQEERLLRYAGFVRSARGGAGGSSVRAPMPGLIREVAVKDGDAVTRGQRLVILEAMKMENEIAAPSDGVVSGCALAPGKSVEKDQELLIITPKK